MEDLNENFDSVSEEENIPGNDALPEDKESDKDAETEKEQEYVLNDNGTLTDTDQSADPAEAYFTEHTPGAESDENTETGQRVNYVWTYAEQTKQDREKVKKEGRRGALTYAIIMTVLFAVCLGILAAVIITGLNRTFEDPKIIYRDRTVFVKDDPKQDGALSIAEVADKVTPSVVGISVTINEIGLTGTSVGTGVIYDKNGYIITNYHVVEGADTIKVVLNDRKRLTAEYVGGDAMSDIAVIKVNYDELTPAVFGNSDELIVGERAIAIGNPSGLDYAGTVTVGYVSAVGRSMKIYDTTGYLVKRMYLIQTDASLNPGNSGGPLINTYGEVIGINTMKLVDTEGIGFSIPINGVLTVARELIANGEYKGNAIADNGVSLGISCIAAEKGKTVSGTSVVAEATGVYVASVDKDRSSNGLLEVGDIITAIDGVAVEDVEELREVLFDHFSGETLVLTVYRGGNSVPVSILLK
ncbi:MAG: trypsin-like peptidase domain-containing protein [Clostridia bacterium]|nr:trypsin-like peptidase domain-containing protein [Clostridia bacterium]